METEFTGTSFEIIITLKLTMAGKVLKKTNLVKLS